MVKRASSIRNPVLLAAVAVQAASMRPGVLHMQAAQTVFKNMMLNESYPKRAFKK